MLVAAPTSLIARMLRTPLRPVTTDPELVPLIARARAGGEVWAVARLPHDAPMVGDVLDLLSVKLAGHVASLVGSIHFTPPYRISVEIELEQAPDAAALGAGLVQKQHELAALDKNLDSVLGALAIHVDGKHVEIIGNPVNIDWLQTLQALLAAVARLKV